ncbi:MAG: hypothetical protein NVSMB4_03680 [Acidimicrobiales bacterium]
MWLVLQLAGLVCAVAGVFVLAGLGWALVTAGVLAAGIAEVRS